MRQQPISIKYRTTPDPIRLLMAEIEAFRSAIREAENALLAAPSGREKVRLEGLLGDLHPEVERLGRKLEGARADAAAQRERNASRVGRHR